MEPVLALKPIIWSSLLSSLRAGTCVLVLGYDIAASPKAVGGVRRADDGKSLRDAFCENLIEQLQAEGQPIVDRSFFPVAQQYADCPAFSTVSLKHIAADFLRDPVRDPGPVETGLARLPFTFVLTTRCDDLFARALASVGKQPLRYWYNYHGEPRDNRELEGKLHPDTPIIYHAFGTYDEPNSLVLTENDLLDCISRIISGRPKLPDSVRNAIRDKTFLFIGFDVRHFFMRVLLKIFMRSLGLTEPSVAIESLIWPDAQEKEQTVLFYRRGTKIELVHAEAEAFVKELQARFEKAGGYTGATTRHVRRAQVFISYERSDEALARRIWDELPKDQFECWLDTALLQVGEDWNQEIEDKIRSSDYFVVLSSQNLVGKAVGYVNKEIALALDQQRYRSAGVKFVIPLVIGGLDPAKGRRELQAIQQFSLRPESFSEDLHEVARTLWRDYQLRNR